MSQEFRYISMIVHAFDKMKKLFTQNMHIHNYVFVNQYEPKYRFSACYSNTHTN